MAVNIELLTTILDNGDAAPSVNGGGSNRLQLSLGFGSDNNGGASTISDHQIGGVNFAVNSAVLDDGPGSPFFKAFYGYNLDGNAQGPGTYDFAVNTDLINTDCLIAELSGVDQSAPIQVGSHELTKTGTTTSAAGHDYTIDMEIGDRIFAHVSTATGGVTNTPANVGVDSWVVHEANQADIVGGAMNTGSLFSLVATEVHTAVSIKLNTTATVNHLASQIVVVTAAVVSPLKTASGDPSITGPTSSGEIVKIKRAIGAAIIEAITASGSVVFAPLDAFGTPVLEGIVSSGVVRLIKRAIGVATLEEIVTSGEIKVVKRLVGSPEIEVISVTGVAEKGPLLLEGAVTIEEIISSGVVRAYELKQLSGATSIETVVSNGIINNFSGTEGMPQIDAIISSGVVILIQDNEGPTVVFGGFGA